MPPAVVEQYNFLRQYRVHGRSTNSGSQYWEKCISEIGIVDTDRGMRLRSVHEDDCASSFATDGNGGTASAVRRSAASSPAHSLDVRLERFEMRVVPASTRDDLLGPKESLVDVAKSDVPTSLQTPAVPGGVTSTATTPVDSAGSYQGVEAPTQRPGVLLYGCDMRQDSLGVVTNDSDTLTFSKDPQQVTNPVEERYPISISTTPPLSDSTASADSVASVLLQPTPLREKHGSATLAGPLICPLPGNNHAKPAEHIQQHKIDSVQEVRFKTGSRGALPSVEHDEGGDDRRQGFPRAEHRLGQQPEFLKVLAHFREQPFAHISTSHAGKTEKEELLLTPNSDAPREEPGLLPSNVSLDPTLMRVASFLSAQPTEEPEDLPPVELSKDAILERTQLARSLVGTLVEMRDGTEDQADELYSLGEELYELFSGRRMFDGECPAAGNVNDAGLVDSRLEFNRGSSTSQGRQKIKRGRQFPKDKGGAPGEAFMLLNEMGFPASLCDLVSSLFESKIDASSGGGNNDDRFCYHSVNEVESDLCLLSRHPELFLYDSTDNFLRPDIVSEELYGREREISCLIEVYDRVIARRAGDRVPVELVLVSGYSGSGKSAVVGKACTELEKRGAHYLSAKFDAMQRSQPLFVFARVLDNHLHLLLQRSAMSELEEMKSTVLESVGDEWRVLAALIPSLGTIIGSSEYSPVQVGSMGAKPRLYYLFRMLFRAIGSCSNPIVFFLDDLQWADSSSLELLHFLVTDSQSEGLFFIGAYRENEVGPDHPLAVHMQSFDHSEQVNVSKIRVGNMDRESVNSLISDALHLLPRRTRGLTNEVMHKTGGNALFVQQFLFSLCDDGLLHFSLSTRRWEWDTTAIRKKDVADNVVGLMKAKISRLAPEVHSALKVASLFGAQFHENLLHIIDRSPELVVSTAGALDIAISEGLMMKVETTYRFSHDQIWSAAYMCIPESERAAFHLQVGRFLWRNSSDEELQTHLFVVVDQLHNGACLITDDNERVNLAELSLIAGHHASFMSAFSLALSYLKGGIGLLVDGDWVSHRNTCFDLHNSVAEMECTLGTFDSINSHLEPVLTRSNTLQEKLRAYFTLIQSMGARGCKKDAINTAIEVLGLLGEPIPAVVTKREVLQEVIKTQELLGTKTRKELLDMETMRNPEKLDVMKLLYLTVRSDYAWKKVYQPLLACRMVQLSLMHGMCKESSIGFACYGVIVSCGVLNDYGTGSHFGKLALALLDKFDAKDLQARVYGVVHGMGNWTESIQSSLPCLEQAIDMGLRAGDTEWAMLNAHLYSGAAILSGYPLEKLVDKMKERSKQMVEYNQHLTFVVNAPVRQAALNLLGHSADPVKLVGEEMDEDQLLSNAEVESHGPLRSGIYVFRTWLAYLFGQYELAAESAQKNECFGKSRMSRFVMVCCHVFYSGLNALALAHSEGLNKWEGLIKETMEKMQGWASLFPWNCEHKLELMKAEYAYVTGNSTEAEKLYISAIDLSAKHRFIHEHALALERAGIFHLGNGDSVTASDLFTRSHDCYAKWGAHCKADQVKELYL